MMTDAIRKRLASAPTLETVLLLLQPDAMERIPDAKLDTKETLDLSVFSQKIHEEFRAVIGGNSSLKVKWETGILPSVEFLKKHPENAEDPEHLTLAELNRIYKNRTEERNRAIKQIKIASDILKWVDPLYKPALPPENWSTSPPGFATASSVGTALLMFQPDDREKIPMGSPPSDFAMDISIFDSPAREQFEKMLKSNPELHNHWYGSVIAVLHELREPERILDNNPNIITLQEMSEAYKDMGGEEDTRKRDNAIAYLQMGVDLLYHVQWDERPWISRNHLQRVGTKRVLGSNPNEDLSSIPALWFDSFAQKLGLQKVLGDSLYEYLLNGGYARDDRVSHQELAEIAEIDGHSKGFFTRLIYGLGDDQKRQVQKAIKDLQNRVHFGEYRYQEGDKKYSIQLYIDPFSPFVEVWVATEGGGKPTILRNATADQKKIDTTLVENPGNIPIRDLRRILWELRFALPPEEPPLQVQKTLKGAFQV